MFVCLVLFLWPCRGVATDLAMVGLGTAGIEKVSTILEAIQMGYRTLDTALIYRNHQMVREAIVKSGIDREEFFLTSKVGFFPSSMALPEEHQPAFGLEALPIPSDLPFHPLNVKGKEIEAIELSLKELGVQYLDLCLIHVPATSALELSASFFPHLYGLWPKLTKWTETTVLGALNALTIQEVKHRQSVAKQERKRSWQNMEAAKKRGLCRHIGVSNYPVDFMKEIDEYKTEPIYNQQQELHPLAQFRDVQEYARKAKVALTGYGTGVVVSTPLAQEIALKMNRSAGQVLLRWAVQKGVHVTPKSNQVSRLKENLEVLDFALDEEDMAALDSLDGSKIFYWNTTILVPQASPVARAEL